MLDESVAVYCLATKFMPKAPKFQKVSSEVCIFRFAKQIIRNSLWTSWNKLPWNKRRPNAKAFWEEDEEIVGGSPHLFLDSLSWNLEILLSRQFDDFLWKIFVKLFHLVENDPNFSLWIIFYVNVQNILWKCTIESVCIFFRYGSRLLYKETFGAIVVIVDWIGYESNGQNGQFVWDTYGKRLWSQRENKV